MVDKLWTAGMQTPHYSDKLILNVLNMFRKFYKYIPSLSMGMPMLVLYPPFIPHFQTNN